LLSFPQGTEMFQFPWFPLPALCVQTGVTPHDGCRVSPFGHPRINARSTASRGFSQSPTSFIGSRRQGIHRWLFVAWKNKFFCGDRLGGSLQRCSCSLCNSQGATKEHRCSGGQRPATLSVAPSKRKRGRKIRARAGDRRTESRPSSTVRDGPASAPTGSASPVSGRDRPAARRYSLERR
jgi:hypothetical protein